MAEEPDTTIVTGENNIAFGYEAGPSFTTGSKNVALGPAVTPLERAIAAAAEAIGKVEMVDAAPSVVRRLQAKRVVCAVLTAIREPSEAMVDAGAVKVSVFDPEHGQTSNETAEAAWQAMIDAALAEGE